MNCAGQLGVIPQLVLSDGEVVIRFRLLKCRLAILADHHECR